MDLIAFLTMLGSAAGLAIVAGGSARLLEGIEALQSVSGNGRLLIATSIAALIGIAAKALTAWLSANPDAVALSAPYWDVIYVAGSILAQQWSHATNPARARSIAFDAPQ